MIYMDQVPDHTKKGLNLETQITTKSVCTEPQKVLNLEKRGIYIVK